MADKVYVTWVEREAARMIVKRDAAKGKTTRPAIVRMANARTDDTGGYLIAPIDQAS